MDIIGSTNIGVFGINSQQIYMKIQKLAESLPKEDIERVRLSREGENCCIQMKNGDAYIGVKTIQGARGYRWKQVYVPYNVDLEILECVILPKLISNLPEHEQIIGYWY